MLGHDPEMQSSNNLKNKKSQQLVIKYGVSFQSRFRVFPVSLQSHFRVIAVIPESFQSHSRAQYFQEVSEAEGRMGICPSGFWKNKKRGQNQIETIYYYYLRTHNLVASSTSVFCKGLQERVH